MSAENRAVVERVNAAFTKGDVEEFLSCCADDVVWTMIGEKSVKGKQAIRNWMRAMPAEPPQFTVDGMCADGDLVTAFGDMTMTQEGTPVPYAYCDVYRIHGGRIAELKSYVLKTNRASE